MTTNYYYEYVEMFLVWIRSASQLYLVKFINKQLLSTSKYILFHCSLLTIQKVGHFFIAGFQCTIGCFRFKID